MVYHRPVLLNESIEGLSLQPSGTYVDVTFGGGGHSKMILSQLKSGKLFAFDQDSDALKNDLHVDGFKLINANYRYLKNFLRMEGVTKIDGLLADLGVSSHQIDVAERGFSTRFDGELDMRMDRNSVLTAKDVINDYCEEDLANMFYKYGELRNSRKIASVINKARNLEEIKSTASLIEVIKNLAPSLRKSQFLSRVFQAIRIEVNDEVKSLQEMLLSAVDILKPGGRLVVISYHSIEDRLVKNLIKNGCFSGILEKDFYGNPIKDLKEINTKVIVAKSSEVKENSRSRSAKLRIAEKINDNKK